MGTPHHHQPSHLLPRRIISWAIYGLMLLALLHFYFFPIPRNQSNLPDPPQRTQKTTTISNPIPSSQANPKPQTQNNNILSNADPSSQGRAGEQRQREERRHSQRKSPRRCADYFDGRWVKDPRGPRYNGTSCGTIKKGQNCMVHGRPDTGYLYWRWRPKGCDVVEPFDPARCLRLLRNKHLAFVGDSMARNQLESLLCLLAVASPPELVYRDGEENKFRRWTFPSHNATVSVFWSPFLVKGVEKSAASGLTHNRLHLDAPDERWASELRRFDMVVFSIGHWFLHPAVYHEGDTVLGCHHCPGLNHTEIGFFDVFRKAIRTALREVRRQHGSSSDKLVVVTTFSPAHFEGEWDKFGACAKQEPYREGEKEIEYMDAEMRKVELEEVAAAAAAVAAEEGGGRLRIEALDVTRLALMRPDGHPGPYMYPNPFAEGVKERVQNDCVHWCLPGPIDTWNEILLQMMMNRWGAEGR